MDDLPRKSTRMNTRKAIKKYKTLSCTSPNYLKIQFTFTSDIHSRTLRASHETQLYIPKPRIELFRNTFVFYGSSIWKSIFKVRYLKWYQSSGEYSKGLQVSVSHFPDRFYDTCKFMKIMYFHNVIC